MGRNTQDGKQAYSPQEVRTHEQLRVLVSELDRVIPLLSEIPGWDDDNSDIVPAEASSEPAMAGRTEGQVSRPGWVLKKEGLRYRGYRKAIYDLLKAAHAAGRPLPKARDVLDEFATKRPFDISEVTSEGLKFYDAKGNQMFANLRAIAKVIGRLVHKEDASAD